MCQFTEDFERAVQRGLKALEPYAADLRRVLGLSVTGETLRSKVEESKYEEAHDAPWLAREFMQKPRDASYSHLARNGGGDEIE